MRQLAPVTLAFVLAAACAQAAAPVAGAPAPPTAAPSAGATASGAPTSDGLGERRSDGAGVEVVAEWKAGDPLSLEISLDTHSVDLDRFDLAVLASLRINGGEWTAPTLADVPKGGHHRSGTLTFASVPPSALAAAGVIELRITGIAVPERLLRWEPAR